MPRKTRTQSGLVAWLTEATRPLFMIDHRNRMRFFNAGCVKLTGCETGDVIGKKCEYRSEPGGSLSERVLTAFTPPPAVLDGQELLADVSLIDSQGRTRRFQILFLPLFDAQQQLTIVLGMLLEQLMPSVPATFETSQKLHVELAGLRQKMQSRYGFDSLIAASSEMQRVLRQTHTACQSRESVHIQGPPDSGKLHLCRIIHQHSQAAKSPLFVMDCQLLSAIDQRRILKDAFKTMKQNEASTFCLRHVEYLPADLQGWLVERRGEESGTVSFRLLTTSSIDLAESVAVDTFLAECYWMLTVQTITLPTLGDRKQDLELLIQYFIEEENRQRDGQLQGVEPATLKELLNYSWPGEMAELKRVLKLAAKNCTGSIIERDDLPFEFQTGQQAQALMPPSLPQGKTLEERLHQFERTEIEQALEETGGNKAQAAERLGLTRAKFYRRLESLGIE